MRSILLLATFLFAGALYGAAPTQVTTIPLNSSSVTGIAANLLTNKVYVVDKANGVTQILDTIASGVVTNGTVTLNQAAPAGGVTVNLFPPAIPSLSRFSRRSWCRPAVRAGRSRFRLAASLLRRL